jgi:hypothetical protein
MKVKPKENYELLGTNIKANKNLIYQAEPAINQPNYKEEGLIFLIINGFLLKKGEYTIISE